MVFTMPGTVLGTALNKWYFRRVEVRARAKEGRWSHCYLGVPTESNAKALNNPRSFPSQI